MNTRFISILIVLIIIWLYIATANDSYLIGHWVADDEFNEHAGTTSILLTIGEATGWIWRERNAYLVILDDISNTGIKMKYRLTPSFGLDTYSVSAQLEFDDPDETIFPPKVEISIDKQHGEMKIHSGKTIYARLYKNHILTNYIE